MIEAVALAVRGSSASSKNLKLFDVRPVQCACREVPGPGEHTDRAVAKADDVHLRMKALGGTVTASEHTDLGSRSQKLDGHRLGQLEPQPDDNTHRWRQLERQQALDAAELRVGDSDVEACSSALVSLTCLVELAA
jgi:hypothetical protein